MKLEDVMTWDKPTRPTDEAGVYTGFFEGLAPCNVVGDDAEASGKRPNNSLPATSFLESEYLFTGAVGTVAGNGTPTIHYKIKLDRFVNTIMALDKNIYFGGEFPLLELQWNALNRILFTSTSATNPSDATALAPTVNVGEIQNLQLRLAVDSNPDTIAETMDAVDKGNFKVTVPWTEHFSSTVQQGNKHMINWSLTSDAGRILQKIYYAPFNINQTGNDIYDHSNLPIFDEDGIHQNNEKINTLRTKLDSDQLQEADLVFSAGDDYYENRDRNRGSDILSFDEHYANYCHVENFTHINKKYHDDTLRDTADEDLISGELLTGPNRIYSITAIKDNGDGLERILCQDFEIA